MPQKVTEWIRVGFIATTYIVRMTLPPLVGGFLGFRADERLGTGPLMLTIGVILGLILSIFALYRKLLGRGRLF